MFKIGTQYLTYQQTRYFMKGAHLLRLGSIGTKNDLLGSFDYEMMVPDIEGVLSRVQDHTSTVSFVGMRSTSGMGRFRIAEISEHLKGDLRAGGSSTEVIIGKFELTDLPSVEMILNVVNDQDTMTKLSLISNPAMVDSIVKVAAMRKVRASDFDLSLSFDAIIEQMLRLGVGVNVHSSSLDDITVSPGTIIGYRLVKLKRHGNGFRPKRDEPGL